MQVTRELYKAQLACIRGATSMQPVHCIELYPFPNVRAFCVCAPGAPKAACLLMCVFGACACLVSVWVWWSVCGCARLVSVWVCMPGQCAEGVRMPGQCAEGARLVSVQRVCTPVR